MSRHTIEVDSEVFQFLKERAEPLVDTPNSVLRKVLLGDRALPGPFGDRPVSPQLRESLSSGYRGRLGHPAALEQILEVFNLVVREGKHRVDATHQVASRLGVAFQTVLDKYTRQLGIDAARFEALLAQDGHPELRRLLLQRFPRHAGEIRKVLDPPRA